MYIKYLGKIVGVLRDDKTYITYRNESHIFRKYNGIGISTRLLLKLRGLGCRMIIIILTRGEETVKLQAPISKFLEEGQIYTDNENDHQKILNMQQLNQNYLLQYIDIDIPPRF